VITFAIKAAGPIVLGGRELPGWFSSIVALMPSALLSALVVTHTLANGKHLQVGAATAGVLASAVVIRVTGSIPACVVTAAVVTALLRAL
jgi:branched-subunit amino acid transport protein